jgi:hypothetical protein
MIIKGALEVLAQLGTNMNAADNVGNTALHKVKKWKKKFNHMIIIVLL